jgi:hypothetical protein
MTKTQLIESVLFQQPTLNLTHQAQLVLQQLMLSLTQPVFQQLVLNLAQLVLQ